MPVNEWLPLDGIGVVCLVSLDNDEARTKKTGTPHHPLLHSPPELGPIYVMWLLVLHCRRFRERHPPFVHHRSDLKEVVLLNFHYTLILIIAAQLISKTSGGLCLAAAGSTRD